MKLKLKEEAEEAVSSAETESVPEAESPETSKMVVDTENTLDPLKRSKKFSWKSFGGDGFIFSLVFHGILLIVAIFLVVRHIAKQEEEPDAFITGAGGGNNGADARMQQHRMKPRQNMIQSKARITSKSSTASIVLPEMPTMAVQSSFGSTGMSAGGDSSGFGGGSGGGVGTGRGIGVGGGSNFISKFGSSGAASDGIEGRFYDLKMKPDGGASPLVDRNANTMERYINVGRAIVNMKKAWDTKPLEKYFLADLVLSAPSQIFIPGSSADDAPKAFGLEKNKGERWFVHYKGNVMPNKSGTIRLVGCADDILCVRLGNRVALDCGFDLLTEKVRQAGGPSVGKVLGVSGGLRGQPPGFGSIGMRNGPAIKVQKGKAMPFECLIGETPGGIFCALLLFEELDKKGKPIGKPKLFRFYNGPAEETFAEEILQHGQWNTWNQQLDMEGGGWEFRPTKRRSLGF